MSFHILTQRRCAISTVKQQIAEVFRRHVDQSGYGKTTLDEVARELRISKKTIYVHFGGKREIYAYIVDRQAAKERKRLATAVADLPTYAARVEAVMELVLGSARAHIAETDRDEWIREYEIAADAFRKANGDLIRELVQAGMDAGEFKRGDSTLVEKMIAAMIVEYLLLVNDEPSFDRDAELLVRIRAFIG